ncbi:MAG: hypothetical protein U5M53_06490 [Rhodoferax sp.]|nr:hypothetical protein [Rhodoferax sp.]
MLDQALASTGATSTKSANYKSVEEVDIPALPQTNWILPTKKGYLEAIKSFEFRVWVDTNGIITGVALLDIRPQILATSELNEIVEWLSNTPMQAAQLAGQPVANVRTIEVVLENGDR